MGVTGLEPVTFSMSPRHSKPAELHALVTAKINSNQLVRQPGLATVIRRGRGAYPET